MLPVLKNVFFYFYAPNVQYHSEPTELLEDSDEEDSDYTNEDEESESDYDDEDYEDDFEDDHEALEEEETAPGFLTQNQINHVTRRNSQPYASSTSSSSTNDSEEEGTRGYQGRAEEEEESESEDSDHEYNEREYSAKEKREIYSVALIVIKKLVDGNVIESHYGGTLKELLFINDKRVMKPIAHYMETEDIGALFQALRSIGLDAATSSSLA